MTVDVSRQSSYSHELLHGQENVCLLGNQAHLSTVEAARKPAATGGKRRAAIGRFLLNGKRSDHSELTREAGILFTIPDIRQAL